MAEKVKDDKEQTQVMGEIRTIGSTELGDSPKEKDRKQQEKIEAAVRENYRKSFVRTFKTQLLQVKQEVDQGKTFEDILKDINDKKSNMTRSARDFCTTFKGESIMDYIKDLA